MLPLILLPPNAGARLHRVPIDIKERSKELMELANVFSINKAQIIIDEIKAIVYDWRKYAKISGVSKSSIKTIETSLNTIRSRF